MSNAEDKISAPAAREQQDVEAWLKGDLLGLVSGQVTSSLDYLHNATNWALVLVSGALAATIATGTFPSQQGLYALSLILVFAAHFFCRSAKGYINVIRYSLVQRMLINSHLSLHALADDIDVREAVRKYIVLWNLPLKRIDVFRKMLFELGFGYLLGAILGLIGYTIAVTKPEWPGLLVVGAAVLLAILEIAAFVQSPYMRNASPNIDARRDR